MEKKDCIGILKFSFVHSLCFLFLVEAVLMLLTVVLPGRALIWLIPLMFPKTLLILFFLVSACALIIKKYFCHVEFRRKVFLIGSLLYAVVTFVIVIIITDHYSQMVSSAFRRSYSSEVYRYAGNVHLHEAFFFNVLVFISFIVCTTYFFYSWNKNARKYLHK